MSAHLTFARRPAPKRQNIGKGLLPALVGLSLILLASTVVEAQSSDDGPPAAADSEEVTVPQDLGSPDRISKGRHKFIATCGYCHGQEGDAGKNRAFRERPADWDPVYLHDTIVNGKRNGANVMPWWGGTMPDDEIWNIVAYIKSLSGKPRPTM